MSQQQPTLKEGLLNLDDIILSYAESIYEKHERKSLEKALECKLPWNQLRREIDTRELLIHTSVPCYESETPSEQSGENSELESDKVPLVTGTSQVLQPATSNSCVFRTVYTNACQHDVVNTINTTRSTRASCSFRVTRGLVLNRQIGLKLALPKDILEFNVGFSSEFSMESEASKTVEQEISWSVNTEVRVPGSPEGGSAGPSRVTAEILIEEKEFRARFTAVTHLSGKIKVRLYSQDDRYLLAISVPNLRNVFTRELGFRHPESADSSKVAFIATGHCHSRFGVSQTVNILPST